MKKRTRKSSYSDKKFNKILKDIREVKIQGATNIAKAGIRAFLLIPKTKNQKEKKAIKKILKTRPTEPLMQNAIRFLRKSKNQNTQKARAKKFLDYIKISNIKISKKAAKLIKNNMNIFTHCHSSTVIDILKYAQKKRKKNFIVYTTEVEPLLQGRTTAKELARSKIKTIIFPDMAAGQAMKKCDIFLFGADAFTKKGVANKIGTSTLCKLAKDFHIPRYSCGTSLKFTKNKLKLETRPSKEVWDLKEKNKKIQIINPAFDFTNKNLLTGVISEFGIHTYKTFITKAKQNLRKFI